MNQSSTVSDMLAVFSGVCADPYACARTAAAEGRAVAGHVSCYTPHELLHAAGYLPVRIMGRMGSAIQRADSHLPAFACSFAHNVLEMGLNGELDFLDLVVFVHTCDTMQNLAEIWKWNIDSAPVVTVSMPILVKGELPTAFYRTELGRLRDYIDRQVGKVADSDIRRSMDLYSEQRMLMRRLYSARRKSPGTVTGKDMMRVVLAAFLMPVEDHLPPLRDLVDAVECETANRTDDRPPRVLVVGSELPAADYVAAVEQAGCIVVDDELSTGSQAFSMPADTADDPLDALAGIYLNSTPGSAQHRPGYDVGKHLVERSRRSGASGVVFLLTKFCDPWFFDYPSARDTLEEAGIPTLLLEIEVNQEPGQQLLTRAAAFVEMLEAR